MVLAHSARREGNEVVTVVDIDEVLEPDVATRRLPVNKTGEVVCGRYARCLTDLPSCHGRGLEPHVLLAAVNLDDDVDGVGMGSGTTFLRSFGNNVILVHCGLLSSIIFIEILTHERDRRFLPPLSSIIFI